MKLHLLLFAVALAAALLIALVGPASGSRAAAPLGPAFAHAQKGSGDSGGSGAQAERVGENAADLASDILVPILIVAVGAIALVALMRREVGMAISVALIGLIAGWFLMAPDSVERVFKGVYERIT